MTDGQLTSAAVQVEVQVEPVNDPPVNTRAVFGEYISVYDTQRAVQDGATVPIYYESRLAKLALDEAERPKIDPAFVSHQLSKWATRR